MPLPIPDILERASKVLKLAKKVTSQYAKAGSIVELKDALKTVSPSDLLAVLNEIAGIFQWMNNIQIQSIGSMPDFKNKKFALGIVLACPLGDRQLTIPLTIEQAKELIKSFQDTMNALVVTEGKLILDTGSA